MYLFGSHLPKGNQSFVTSVVSLHQMESKATEGRITRGADNGDVEDKAWRRASKRAS